MHHILFISDLHLNAAYPEKTTAFLQFLSQRATQAEALYILGDFFDLWLGDDDHSEFSETIMSALFDFSKNNIPIYLMHGNHDFLIGKKFLQASRINFIKDPTIIKIYSTPILLTHGDCLCTQDTRHQQFRKIYTNSLIRKLALTLPIRIRRLIANKINDKSPTKTDDTLKIIFDVTEEAVLAIMRYYNIQLLIHGHTHRPAIHSINVNGKTGKRIVLGAWDHEGYYLIYDENKKFELQSFPIKNFAISLAK